MAKLLNDIISEKLNFKENPFFTDSDWQDIGYILNGRGWKNVKLEDKEKELQLIVEFRIRQISNKFIIDCDNTDREIQYCLKQVCIEQATKELGEYADAEY